MDDKIKVFEEKMQKSLANLEEEFAGIRAGRANPHVLDKLRVDYYGSPTPIQSVANVNVPEPRMIQIQPWEASMVKEIEKAIIMSDLGINPTTDGKVIRLVFPELTEERRKDLSKEVKKKAEEAGAKIIVFPELCITGYTCQDLFTHDVLLDASKEALLKIAEHTVDKDALIFVGLPFAVDGELYNVAAAVQDGEVLAFIPKAYIPNYAEFYEARHFAKGMEAGAVARVAGRTCGVDACKQAVLVAVVAQFNQLLSIAAGFALQPQFLPGTAPETGQFLFHGDLQALPVHIGKGQHPSCDGIHHNGGDQPVLVKFECIYLYHW